MRESGRLCAAYSRDIEMRSAAATVSMAAARASRAAAAVPPRASAVSRATGAVKRSTTSLIGLHPACGLTRLHVILAVKAGRTS